MWGRAVGVVFLVPCTYFWMKGHFSAAMKKRMLLATGLVISQACYYCVNQIEDNIVVLKGLVGTYYYVTTNQKYNPFRHLYVGWWMVKSGLGWF